jgi:hypothetical protein
MGRFCFGAAALAAWSAGCRRRRGFTAEKTRLEPCGVAATWLRSDAGLDWNSEMGIGEGDSDGSSESTGQNAVGQVWLLRWWEKSLAAPVIWWWRRRQGNLGSGHGLWLIDDYATWNSRFCNFLCLLLLIAGMTELGFLWIKWMGVWVMMVGIIMCNYRRIGVMNEKLC